MLARVGDEGCTGVEVDGGWCGMQHASAQPSSEVGRLCCLLSAIHPAVFAWTSQF